MRSFLAHLHVRPPEPNAIAGTDAHTQNARSVHEATIGAAEILNLGATAVDAQHGVLAREEVIVKSRGGRTQPKEAIDGVVIQ